MSIPLPHVQHLYEMLRDHVTEAVQWVRDRLHEIWRRHLDFMNEREGYRTQVVAGVAALVAVTELDPRLAALLVALLGLHAAAFGHRPPSLRPRSSFDDDPRWDPFG